MNKRDTIKRFLFRIKHLPIKLWLCKNIGDFTAIDSRYVAICGINHIRIGEKCKIMSGLRLEAITSYSGKNYKPHIIVGDNVCINQNFHCTCASKVLIGDGTSFTANCGVFDISHPYKDINKNPREEIIEVDPVIIGKNCLIGMNSVIMPGVILGNHSIIGANSTVLKGDYPAYSVLAGSPAQIVRQYNFCTKEWEKCL